MCREVVAAPLSLQDTVYPILSKKSLHFCEKLKKFLKLCTAVRKKHEMKRLRKKNSTPSVKTCRFCQLPLGGSLWRGGAVCGQTASKIPVRGSRWIVLLSPLQVKVSSTIWPPVYRVLYSSSVREMVLDAKLLLWGHRRSR